MQVGILGLNHKSARLELREKLARCSSKRFGAHCSFHGMLSYVLLTTCNRTEIYFSSDDLAATHSYFLSILRSELEEEFEHTLYSYFGSECFFHLAKVTCGMDSAIVGETEIQGQVKRAYEEALCRPLATALHYLFQKSLKIGKIIRQAPLMPSLEETVFTLSTTLVPTLSLKRILFIGVSEINLKVLKLFLMNELKNITLCNRTAEKGREIAKKYGASFLPWEERYTFLSYDLVICGTKAPHCLVRKEEIAETPSEMRVVLDLGVPRNIDPGISHLPYVTLRNIDQISRSIDGHKKVRAHALCRLRMPLIEELVCKQLALFHKRENFMLTRVS